MTVILPLVPFGERCDVAVNGLLCISQHSLPFNLQLQGLELPQLLFDLCTCTMIGQRNDLFSWHAVAPVQKIRGTGHGHFLSNGFPGQGNIRERTAHGLWMSAPFRLPFGFGTCAHCRLTGKNELAAIAQPPRAVGWLLPGVCDGTAEEAACKASSCSRTKPMGSAARTVLTVGSVSAITRCALSGSRFVRVDTSAACSQFSVSSMPTKTLYLMDSWSFGQSGSGCPPRATQA